MKLLLCLTGDAGSGKSFFLRRLLHFLYGSGDSDTSSKVVSFNKQRQN